MERDDILSRILKSHPQKEPPIPRHEMVHDLSQLYMGGSTTTAALISWTLLYTYQDREWLAELREELASWDAARLIKMNDFPKLRATLFEIERLKPSIPIFLRIAAKDFAFRGYRIPKDTPVIHLHTLCHFLEDHYADPLKFNPRRFLENPGLPERDIHGTYGGGEHGCVGQNLARVAPVVAVGDIVSRYDLEFVDGPPSMKERYDVTTAPAERDIRVRFVPRSGR